MSPKIVDESERKLQILTAAFKTFNSLGFKRSRMEDVAKEANLAKGTLYLYFKNKETLLISLAETLFDRELGKIQDKIPQHLPAFEKINFINQALVTEFEQMGPTLSLMYEFYALGLRNETIRNILSTTLDGFLNFLVPLFEEASREPDYDIPNSELAAQAIGSIVEGAVLLWAYNPKRINLNESLQFGLNQIMKSFQKR